jgi:hypothetical protein
MANFEVRIPLHSHGFMYHLIGKTAKVHLYDRRGILLGTIAGTISDVAANVEVAPRMHKDLILLTGIENYRSEEGWFAVQDAEIEDQVPFMRN